jgi:hypothetical protein
MHEGALANPLDGVLARMSTPVVPPFVGIRKGPEKAALLARGTGRRALLPTHALAFDCLRHAALLRAVDADADDVDLLGTVYGKFQRAAGRSEQEARARCRRFADLYRSVRAHGFDAAEPPPAVTEDGIRLDGSHRVAIAHHLTLPELEVAVFRLEDAVAGRRLEEIREEARVKRDGQERAVGRRAVDRADGKEIGLVVAVTSEALRRVPWRGPQEVLVVEIDDGGATLVRRRERDVVLT